jgi:hypothetical protein
MGQYGLVVVLTILYVIPAHNFDLTEACILLPLRSGVNDENYESDDVSYVEKVDLF